MTCKACSRYGRGFTQLELMIALALGSGLSLLAAQYYQHAVSMMTVQQQLQERTERMLVLRQAVGADVRHVVGSWPACSTLLESQIPATEPATESSVPVDSGSEKPGTTSRAAQTICPEWVATLAGDLFVQPGKPRPGSALEPDGDVLIVHAPTGATVTEYFTARGSSAGGTALYRRRGSADGDFQSADELVSGWSALWVGVCYQSSASPAMPSRCESARLLGSLQTVFNVPHDDSAGIPFAIRICAVHEMGDGAVPRVTGFDWVSDSLGMRSCLQVGRSPVPL